MRYEFSEGLYDFSEGFARLRADLLGQADHAPFIQQSHEFNMNLTGTNARDYYSNPEALVHGACRAALEMGFDLPDLCWDAYNIEAEALGAKVVMFDDLCPALDNLDPIVTSEKDLARLKSPDPTRDGRMPFVFDSQAIYQELTGGTPSLVYCAPFTLATQLLTFERVVLGIKDDPKFIHKVLTFIVDEVLAPYVNAFCKRFPEAKENYGSDAVASLPFITLDMLEEFSLQYIERLREKTGGRVVCDNWWGDSFVDDPAQFWAMKLRATPSYLKVQDPDLWKVGAQTAKAHALAKGVPLMLGVSNNLLQDGPVEEIQKRIHEYLEVGSSGGRFTLYLCSLSSQTPLAHVKAAVEAIRMFRRGERPWAGLRRSGTAEARDDSSRSDPSETQISQVQVKQPSGLAPDQELLLDDLFDLVVDGASEETPLLVQRGLDMELPVQTILEDSLIAAMEEIGQMFSDGTIFVPEMLLSARAMKGGLEVLRPILTKTAAKPKGLVLLATVQGDVHDIGKNLVGMMLEGAGFTVVDIGINVSPEDAIQRALELQPDVIGLSALLTTTMPQMGRIIRAFRAEGLSFPIIVGGAPVTAAFAETIEADGYADDAPGAVELVKSFVASSASAEVPMERWAVAG